jgi:predicted SAM-dependent methyltransferase
MTVCDKLCFVKYILTASVLKLFSLSPKFYRFLGNKFGCSKITLTGVPDKYRDRAKQFLTLCEKHEVITDGDNIIEIGTGWVHFESIVLRLFYDVKTTLFDVWDNRHFESLKTFVKELEKVLYITMDINEVKKRQIKKLIETISKSSSFDQLYNSLGFQYVLNTSGALKKFNNESFQLVYSHHVLEHVSQKIVYRLIKDLFRVLKPGGCSIHKIDLGDHLVSFAGLKHISKKYYLKYSDKKWERFFENKVQHINRIQRPEWHSMFKEAGFNLVEEQVQTCHIHGFKVAEKYSDLMKNDLECESMILVHRKPDSKVI